MTDRAPAVVTLHVWGIAPAAVPRAVARVALDRGPLRRTPGLGFAKLLGTGRGHNFSPSNADPLHWALLATWDTVDAAAAFEGEAVCRRWNAIGRERLLVSMRPVTSRGRWGGVQPFGDPPTPAYDGPVAAVTRARIAVAKSRRFWRAVPPVAAQLERSPGLRFALGIADIPLVLQGTFSLWESSEGLNSFAYGNGAHSVVVRRTSEVGWFAESLFARFEVLSVSGSYEGKELW